MYYILIILETITFYSIKIILLRISSIPTLIIQRRRKSTQWSLIKWFMCLSFGRRYYNRKSKITPYPNRGLCDVNPSIGPRWVARVAAINNEAIKKQNTIDFYCTIGCRLFSRQGAERSVPWGCPRTPLSICLLHRQCHWTVKEMINHLWKFNRRSESEGKMSQIGDTLRGIRDWNGTSPRMLWLKTYFESIVRIGGM